MSKCIVFGICNQKGGVGKTTLTMSLGAALTRMGHKVCLIDCDPQANATMALGYQQPDELPVTLSRIMNILIKNDGKLDSVKFQNKRKFIFKSQGMDFIPSCIGLATVEINLIGMTCRENYLKKFVDFIKDDYDFVLLDGMPSLNILTVNTLNAADRVLIPTQPQYFSAKGIELLLSTIATVKENLNPNLIIEGALITMYDNRLNFHKEVLKTLNTSYGSCFKVFNTKIPMSVRVTESQALGKSLFDIYPNGKIAKGYDEFARELLANA